MAQHRNWLGSWPPWARIGRALALGATVAACAAPQAAAAAGPHAIDDEPIASMAEPDDEGPPHGRDDAEREQPPLMSEREVDGGIDIRLHRMRDSHDRRAQRWRDRAADAAGEEARPLPPQPPARAGIHAPDDSAE